MQFSCPRFSPYHPSMSADLLTVENRHLPRLQQQPAQHGPETLRTRFLPELRERFDCEPEPEVSELWEGVWK